MSTTTQWDNIFHGLDSTPGKLRMSQGGLGWKPIGGTAPDATVTIPADHMHSFHWVRVARNYQLCIHLNRDRETPLASQPNPRRSTFDGFLRDDYDKLASQIRQFFAKPLDVKEISTRGWNWGKAAISNTDVHFLVRDKLAFELPLAHLANSNIAKTEVSMEFLNPEQQQPAANTGASSGGGGKSKKGKGDQLVEMRLYIPGQASKDDASDAGGAGGDDGETETAAEAFHEALKSKADIGQVAGDSIVVFKEVLVLTPRGRYDIDVFHNFIRLRGKTYDYKILHSSMSRLFLLPKSDEIHVMLVIGLDPPIRQGQTRYPYLVLQFPREEEMDAELNVDEATLASKYEGKLKKRYEEPTFRIVTNMFKVLSGQKVATPGEFESSSGQSSVKCNVKATDGSLYPLEKSLLWVSKQPVYVPYAEVHQAVLSRVGGAVASSKTFDLRVVNKSGGEHTFQSISREELERLKAHLAERKVKVKNEVAEEGAGLAAQAAALLSDDEDMEVGRGQDEDEDSEEDEDFRDDSEDDGGSPSEASSDEEDQDGDAGGRGEAAGGGGSEGEDRPKKKKRKD
ncbi:FACT complex subunit [Thecaphora frezii]